MNIPPDVIETMGKHDDMLLPAGQTCRDCEFYGWCWNLFGCAAGNTRCDWSPSRFSICKCRAALSEQQREG